MTKTLTGRHVGLAFIAFFGTIFTVNMTMAVLAKSSWSGLIAKNGYVASKALADSQSAAHRATGLGWGLTAEIVEDHLRVTHIGAPDGTPVVARLLRPVDEQNDRSIELTQTGDGGLESIERIPSGNWLVTVKLGDGTTALERILRTDGTSR